MPLEQPGQGRVTLAELLGELIWEELSDCLIHNCLVKSIPTNSSKLEQYKEVGPRNPLEFEQSPGTQCDAIPVVNALQNLLHPLLLAFRPGFTLLPDFRRVC